MASPIFNSLKRPLDSTNVGESLEPEAKKQCKEFEPRSYQVAVFEVARQRNTIAVLDTGAGKTMIAVMLIRQIGHEAKAAGDTRIIVFLAPTVHLVNQQYEVIKIHTDLEVGQYYGAKGVDDWTAKCWEREISTHQVLVMTPQILLDAFRNAFLTLDMVCLLIFDECHRATGNHPYTRIMKEFYHKSVCKPHIFGMTASPVIRKGVASVVDCEDQLCELEKILNSKIYTVADRTEVEIFVPAAKEVNWYYDPTVSTHESLKIKLGALWNNIDTLMAQLQHTPSDQYRDTNEIIKASRKRLSSCHAKICHCLEDLGLICALEAAKICMEVVRLPSCSEGCDFSRESLGLYNSFLEEVLHAIEESLPHDYESLLKPDYGCLEAITLGYVSPKLHELIKVFQSLGESNQVLCLIFVERIITSKVIERFMKKISYLSHFTVSYLTGGSSSMDALTPKLQKETLDLFRSRKVNLLFTTDVAEEGIHVPDCSCVIRFDLPKTVRSYVQSCGRARQAGSCYVVMLERGNMQQRDLLFGIIRSKHSMIDTALNRDPDSSVSNLSCDDGVDIYRVESTGATITADSSISLVYKYCEKLPKDKYFTPKPVFQYSMYGGCYECTLTLPPNAAFRTLVGPVNRNSHAAKQLVCLEACKQLHKLGVLSDNLLPIIEEPIEVELEVEVDESKRVSATGVGTTKRKELHGSTTISALAASWAHQKTGVTLHGYKLIFACDQVGQNYSGFVLLINASLDKDVACTEVDLYLQDKLVKANARPSGLVELDNKQVEQAKIFQEFFFNGLFGKLFTGSGVQRKFLLKGGNESLWSTSNMYLLLPLEPSCTKEDDIININWKAIDATSSVVEIMRNNYSTGAELSLTLSSGLSLTGGAEVNMISLANKLVSHQDLKDLVVLAVHTGKIYSVLEVISGSSANSKFDAISDKSSSAFRTYSEYFNKKYGIVLLHPGQPLLLLKQSHSPHNLLSSKSRTEGDSTSQRSSNGGVPIPKPQNHVHMPPELLLHVDVPLHVLRSFYLLPSLMHRLESLMLACQLRKEIAFASSNASISSLLILEAITTIRCCEDFSLERLELLGDSVLKYAVSCHLYVKFPEKHEGQLSARRTSLVCNATLHKLGTERNVQGYIRDAAFDPRRWVAPGQLSLRPAPCTCGVGTSDSPLKVIYENEDKSIVIGKACDSGHRWICSKTISDSVEALIGAYYVGGGLRAALALLKWLGIDADSELGLVEEAMKTASMWSYLPKANEIEVLESKLKYNFTVKGLLLEAITHAFQQELGVAYCYQRLEFLGDSVLDLLITWHLFTSHKDIDPGELTDLRSASVNNENFARVAVRHKLQQHLQHGSGLLLEQITEYVKRLKEERENKDLLFLNGLPKGPKVLGDLVESIAGAILIDTKLCLEKVWEIFEPLLSPIATPENLELPPLRKLSELCSDLGYFLNTKCVNEGESVVAELEIQLEDILLTRYGRDKNKKTAKAQAAFLLLKDMEEKGCRHPSKRRRVNDKCGDEEKDPSSGNQKAGISARFVKPLKSHKSIDSEIIQPAATVFAVSLPVKMQKGGPRIALYELCKKMKWPMPILGSMQDKSSTPQTSASECHQGRNSQHSFVSTITLHLPNFGTIACVGEKRPDKKSSQDSAALALLYELQKRGRLIVEEV